MYLGATIYVLHCFELVKVLARHHMAAIDFIDRLPEHVSRDEIVTGQEQLHLRREEPSPQSQTRRRGRAVILNVNVVRHFVHLQLALCPTQKENN